MNFVVILIGFLMHTALAYKSVTFPPMDKVRKHYDLDHVLNLCYGKSGADKNELHEFEVTTDLEHLPNSNAMKEYLRCFAEVTEAVETQSNRVLLTKVLKYLDDLTTAQRMIYINMSKGCLTRAGKVTDRLEYTYVLAVCCKQNDNEHFHIFY